MAKNKKQHYVPKFYLSFFSHKLDKNKIGLFSITNEIFLSNVPYKDQAYADYFYGKNGEVEDELAKIESKAKGILKSIIDSNLLPSCACKEYDELLIFSILLAYRTKDSVEKAKEAIDKLVRTVMGHDEKVKQLVDKVRRYPKEPAVFTLNAVVNSLHVCFDLKLKLLVNQTKLPFITSDNPVIKYNQFLEQRNFLGGHTGLSSKGLQLFIPISPNLLLCYYDEWVYKIGDKFKDVVDIIDKEDVEKLNYLQTLNCFEQLFFNESVNEIYIRQLNARAKMNRPKEYSTIDLIDSQEREDGSKSFQYRSYNHNLKTKLNLSFITQTKRAKQHVFNDFAVQIRNEKLRGIPNDLF